MALDRLEGLAVEIESSYNTDPTIAEATDSIRTRNLDVVPLDGDFITRGLDRANLGAEGDILVAKRALMTCEVELSGSGTAGTAPRYDDLVRACGFAAVNGASDHVYNPISTSQESAWWEVNKDGQQVIGGGSRGSMSINMQTRQIPFIGFEMTAMYRQPTAVALPTYTIADHAVPEAFNNANTPTATLDSVAIGLESCVLNIQNQTEHIDRIGAEKIDIVQREIRGTITFEAPALGTKNWFAYAEARTQAALQIIHGDTAGNIVTLDAPKVEMSNPRYTESQGTLMITADLILVPNAGNDELIITLT